MSFLADMLAARAGRALHPDAMRQISEELAWEGAQGADRYLVGFSGGKDSIATALHLLERGIPAHQMELWHHLIDPPGQPFMDWPCTTAYCQAFADAFGIPLYFSGKEGGFERELLRDHQPTAPVRFDTPTGEQVTREVPISPKDYESYLTKGSHPAYQLGFGRVSCMSCIFGNSNQWATVRALNPAHFEKIANYEDQFGVTIRRDESVREAADAGTSFVDPSPLATASQLPVFLGPIRVPSDQWQLPKGAYRKDGGPI